MDVKKADFLSHWMTPNGSKPMQEKIHAINLIDTPKNQTQVRAFWGAVAYYKSI